MNIKQAGFTLIELVVVIVILGLLAATALPRFVNLQTDARIAAVKGVEGAVRSAGTLAHAVQLAQNKTSGTAVTMEGVSVVMTFGYPLNAATGVRVALQDFSGFTFAAGPPSQFQTLQGGVGNATCAVNYTDPAAANTPPVVTVSTGGC